MITQEIRDDQNQQKQFPCPEIPRNRQDRIPNKKCAYAFCFILVVAPKKEEESGQKRKQKAKDPHKPAKKIKVDKSNPNWNLKKRIDIVVLEKDLLFETRNEVPMISTAADSHLIR